MSSKLNCRLGGDSDRLSRLQLEEVCSQLTARFPRSSICIVEDEEISALAQGKTQPRTQERTALLMRSLVSGDIDALVMDAAVVPPTLPVGIALAAVTGRLTPYDVLVSQSDTILDELPMNAAIIANEVRRESQLLYYRPDLKMVRSKGSVDALIQKVKAARIDGVVLSAADVERLNKQDYVAEVFTNSVCVPAAGQGSLAVLVRSGDEGMKKMLRAVNDPASCSEVKAEWSFLNRLGLGTGDPVGVLGSLEGRKLELEGVVALPDGREKIRSVVRGTAGREAELGEALADEILEAGGREILQELNLI